MDLFSDSASAGCSNKLSILAKFAKSRSKEYVAVFLHEGQKLFICKMALENVVCLSREPLLGDKDDEGTHVFEF